MIGVEKVTEKRQKEQPLNLQKDRRRRLPHPLLCSTEAEHLQW